ncbi:BSD domain-containing protein [Striga asiatica]|uniref:BSD domain-containing protein n=1 Tax=Striga asiatica TaxID=4170 RepID=A0A5A7NWC5_STRAF|nr:BSD domain-containing protein [Striga asiatica]
MNEGNGQPSPFHTGRHHQYHYQPCLQSANQSAEISFQSRSPNPKFIIPLIHAMNFFKSILTDDPDPPKSVNPHESDPGSPLKSTGDGRGSDDAAGGWGFGGLLKTLAIDSVIETYRRDLKEFGSGLKKESEILRESASRAVKDLPASLEASASVPQGALEALKLKAEIVAKESLGPTSDGESETPGTNLSLSSARYSWFEAQLGAIQSDPATFCEDPEDVEEYVKWRSGFDLEKNKDEIDGLVAENGNLEGVYKKFVPSAVDLETFWCRYFYRVDKIKQQESVRANLVKRAITVEDEEELSWDFDDDDDEDVAVNCNAGGVNVGKGDDVITDNKLSTGEKQEALNVESREVKEGNEVESNGNGNAKVALDQKEVESEVKRDEKVESGQNLKDNSDEKVIVDEKVNSYEKNGSSVVSGDQPKVVKEEEEEDLGWDEIEDIGSDDEKKVSSTAQSSSLDRTEMRKRLSAGEDDEDLSWDIEDDDEPVKKP